MEKNDFLKLSMPFQLDALISHGKYVDYIINDGYLVRLYEIKSYYAKSYFHIEKNTYDKIIAFEDINYLKKFLNKNKLKNHFPSKATNK